MATIEFRLQTEELGGGEEVTVIPYIGGVSLINLARRVEAVPAAAEGNSHLAGAYAGLVIGDEPWWEWYSGQNPRSWFDDGDSCVLGCTCGVTGCRPLTTVITVYQHDVVWDNFRTGHQDWDLSDLGPLYFDRDAYHHALRHPRTR